VIPAALMKTAPLVNARSQQARELTQALRLRSDHRVGPMLRKPNRAYPALPMRRCPSLVLSSQCGREQKKRGCSGHHTPYHIGQSKAGDAGVRDRPHFGQQGRARLGFAAAPALPARIRQGELDGRHCNRCAPLPYWQSCPRSVPLGRRVCCLEPSSSLNFSSPQRPYTSCRSAWPKP